MSKIEFVTPVGRLVQGSAFEAQDKNMAGQPLTDRQGRPTKRWFVGVAFSKTDPNFGSFYTNVLLAATRQAWPTMFDAQGNPVRKLHMKLMDGDGVDENGKPNANKPGFAGHWVVKFSSGFAPKCYYAGRYQPHEQIQDPKAIPRGYYVRISGTAEGNGDASKPGIYVNLGMVELVGGQPSDIIASGPDASAVFGGQAAQLPPGVAAVLPPTAGPAGFPAPQAMPGAAPGAMPTPGYPAPTLPAPGAMPGQPVPQMPQPGYPGAAPMMPAGPAAMPSPAMPVPGAQPPMGAPGMVPNHGWVAGPGQAPAPAAPGYPVPGAQPPQMPAPGMPQPPQIPQPPAAAGPVMLPAAGGFTYAQLTAQGWTDATLRAAGMMQ